MNADPTLLADVRDALVEATQWLTTGCDHFLNDAEVAAMLGRLLPRLDAALQAPDKLTCEVCFTSSFEPCPEAECGLAHPHPDLAHARCQYCRLVDAYVALTKEAASNRTPLVWALVGALLRENAHGFPAWAIADAFPHPVLRRFGFRCGLCTTWVVEHAAIQHKRECAVTAARALVAAWPEVGG